MTIIEENDFIARFKPETDEGGDYYRQREIRDANDRVLIEQAQRERRLWTAIDGEEGNFCISSGYHFVNRLYYIITEVPVPEGEEYEIQYDDFPEDESDEEQD